MVVVAWYRAAHTTPLRSPRGSPRRCLACVRLAYHAQVVSTTYTTATMAAEGTTPAVPSLALHTGAQMPQLGLGTWLAAPGEVKAAVIAAIEAGYRHIDGAAMYGNEKEVGEGIADCISRGVVTREALFVTTKLRPQESTAERVALGFDKSITDLGLDYVDLYLMHWPFGLKPDCAFPPPPEDRLPYDADRVAAAWKEMEKLVAAGRAKHIGVSNFSVRKLNALLQVAEVKPAALQVESHPSFQQKPLLEFCTRHGIALTAYSPLGNPGRPDRLRADGDPHPMSDATVTGIAAETGLTPAQVLIAWAVQRGTVVIPKSVNPERIAQNLAGAVAGGARKLTDAHMEALAKLDGPMRVIKGAIFTVGEQTWEDLWDKDAEDLAAIDAAA